MANVVNKLLSLPYALKIATKDTHPADHVSFETAHPSTDIKAFESTVDVTNPLNNRDVRKIPIWPAHCVRGTKGAEIIPEINQSKFDLVLEKGKDKNVEMFSTFADIFGNKSQAAASHNLAATLRGHGIKHVDVVGLAGDYCVKHTALDAREEGFVVSVVEEGTRSVNPGDDGWGATARELVDAGAEIVHMDDSQFH